MRCSLQRTSCFATNYKGTCLRTLVQDMRYPASLVVKECFRSREVLPFFIFLLVYDIKTLTASPPKTPYMPMTRNTERLP